MYCKNVRQIVITVLGAIVGAVVTVLLESGVPLAAAVMDAWPALLLGVVAGVVAICAAWLLTRLVRKVRPSFRTRSTRLKDLATEIKKLYHYDLNRLVKEAQGDGLSFSRRVPRVNELRDELSKLGIPSPAKVGGREDFSRWQTFLRDLYGCAIRGDVKDAEGVLGRLEAADQKPTAAGNKAESGALTC